MVFANVNLPDVSQWNWTLILTVLATICGTSAAFFGLRIIRLAYVVVKLFWTLGFKKGLAAMSFIGLLSVGAQTGYDFFTFSDVSGHIKAAAAAEKPEAAQKSVMQAIVGLEKRQHGSILAMLGGNIQSQDNTDTIAKLEGFHDGIKARMHKDDTAFSAWKRDFSDAFISVKQDSLFGHQYESINVPTTAHTKENALLVGASLIPVLFAGGLVLVRRRKQKKDDKYQDLRVSAVDTILKDRIAELNSKEACIKNRESCHASEVAKFEKDRAAKEKELTDIRTIRENDRAVWQTTKAHEENILNTQKAEFAKQVEAKTAEMNAQKAKQDEREQAINKKDNDAYTRAESLRTLQKGIETREANVANREKTATERDKALLAREVEVATRETQVASREAAARQRAV